MLLKVLRYLPLELLLRLPIPKVCLKHVVEGGEDAAEVFLSLWQRIKAMVSAKVLVHRLTVVSQVDVREWLPKLVIPCCYIQATGDSVVPEKALVDFSEAVCDLKVIRIKGPHFILQAQPEKALMAIQSFLGFIAGQSSVTKS